MSNVIQYRQRKKNEWVFHFVVTPTWHFILELIKAKLQKRSLLVERVYEENPFKGAG